MPKRSIFTAISALRALSCPASVVRGNRRNSDKVSGVELETFILNSRCANVDGLCTFQHGLADLVDEENRKSYENACMLLYEVSAAVDGVSDEEAEKILQEKISWERQHFWSALHIDDRPCGGCALHEFEEMGLAGVKIVGRDNAPEKKLKDVLFIRRLLNRLREGKPPKKSSANTPAQSTRKSINGLASSLSVTTHRCLWMGRRNRPAVKNLLHHQSHGKHPAGTYQLCHRYLFH